MKRILVICPLERDRRELALFNNSYQIFFHDINFDDWEQVQNLNEPILKNIINDISDVINKNKIDGVFSTDDYLGTLLAAIVSKQNELLTPDPSCIALMQHKLCARMKHQEIVPEATPQFVALEDNRCELPIPYFIKPVRSRFSRGAHPVHTHDELTPAFEDALTYCELSLWEYLAKPYLPTNYDSNARILAESLCTGMQCTLEGFVFNDAITFIGITDSIMFPGTISFKRFDYPSCLAEKVQKRIQEIATKLLHGINYNNGFFNIEFMYDSETDDIFIIEVNPRLVSQFADLYQKVDGISNYEQLLALISGQRPSIKSNEGEYNMASSCVLRRFHDCTIMRLPTEEELEKVYEAYPQVRIQLYGKEGQRLSDLKQDGKSYRFGLIHIGGDDVADIEEKFNTIQEMLNIILEPIEDTDTVMVTTF